MIEAYVHGSIVERLGDEPLREVLASLWAVDCQTCGRPLAGSTPALVVEDVEIFVLAALHHPGCRRSGWNDRALGGEVAVEVGPPMRETYAAGAGADLRALVRRQGGLQLLVTHAVNPAEVHDLRELLGPLAGDRTLGAWTKLRPS